MVNGHEHLYERFAPQTPTGVADPNGIRQITVGTGGASLYPLRATPAANSEVRDNTTHGVLKLTLRATGYDWQFVPIAGQTFTDAGSGGCHGPGEPPPNQAPVANPGGPYASEATVSFDGSGSTDPDNNLPLTYAWTFGDGATGTGVAPAHTYAADGSYTVTLVVTDAKGLSSAPATTTATIANAAPTVNAGPDATLPPGGTFNLSAAFSDPGTNDAPWTYTIDWGDGSPGEGGSVLSQAAPITASHVYAALGQYAVQVAVTDKDGGTGTDQLLVTVSDAQVLVGAGDIARCNRSNDEATALLLDNVAGTVFTAGDNTYAKSVQPPDFNCYDASWGRHKARTRPAAGHMEYFTAGASSYFAYFGAAAGEPGKGYYSYDLGAWHVVVLNSALALGVGSPQEQWLRADLAAHPNQCTLAYWHHPLFSSVTAGSGTAKPAWDALYAAGAEVVVNGHHYVYERFAPQTPDGAADPASGIRQFTVGTGGISVNRFGTVHPNSEVRSSGTNGVLKLTLRTGGYSWEFIPVAGKTFTDSGSGSCH